MAGPGFLNITLDAAAAGVLAERIVEAGESYGTGSLYAGVSASTSSSSRPTRPGPIHIGGTRWAAVGDSLARLFEAQGGLVTREYYFNDHGAQIDRFARSLLAAHRGEPAPEDGYGGGYILDIAARVEADYPGDLDALPRDEQQEVFRELGVTQMFGEIKASLHEFGVDFDVYFHENSLHESGAVERAIDAAARARPHLRGGRRHLAAHHRVRRRQGPRRHQVATASRPTSPATSPTTSTSASAASTAASSCSAPTTTAT